MTLTNSMLESALCEIDVVADEEDAEMTDVNEEDDDDSKEPFAPNGRHRASRRAPVSASKSSSLRARSSEKPEMKMRHELR
jgi:hypothetical protein